MTSAEAGEQWVQWEKCGPFDEMWTVEELTPTGRVIAECCEEWRANTIIADHKAAAAAGGLLAALRDLIEEAEFLNVMVEQDRGPGDTPALGKARAAIAAAEEGR